MALRVMKATFSLDTRPTEGVDLETFMGGLDTLNEAWSRKGLNPHYRPLKDVTGEAFVFHVEVGPYSDQLDIPHQDPEYLDLARFPGVRVSYRTEVIL